MRNSANGQLTWIVGDHNGTDEMAIIASNFGIVRQCRFEAVRKRLPV
ncbi:hypothetical protein KIPE111705_22790 [Kibdelosporangium persicum]